MGHSNISWCLACNTALTRASIPLFGNETTSSISHGLCAGRDLSDWAKILNQSQLGDEEDSCIWKDAGKSGKVDPHDYFLTTVLAEKRSVFWQMKNDGKRFVTVIFFSLGMHQILLQ